MKKRALCGKQDFFLGQLRFRKHDEKERNQHCLSQCGGRLTSGAFGASIPYLTAPLLFVSRPWRRNQLLRTVHMARNRLVRNTINLFQFGDNQ
jgi:hypothetical protein